MLLQREHNNKVDFYSVDYHKHYKKLYPDFPITQVMHTKIIKTFFSIVVRKIVNEMYRFHFVGLGWMYLTKNKQKLTVEDGKVKLHTAVNWIETLKVRKLTNDPTRKVFYLNEHTNGYVYSIFWDRRKAAFTNKKFYSLLLGTQVKHYIAEIIRNNIKPLNAYIR